MPPKRAPKLSRTASPACVGGGDDSESVISELSDLITETLSVTDSAGALETALTKLLNQRASTRMESLEMFNRLLALHLHEDFLQKELPTIQSGLLSSFKRSIPEETVQACRMVELIVITIGSGADPLLDDIVPVLRSLSRHGAGPVQPAAIRALGTIQLIVGHHTDALHHWMATFSRFFRRKDAAVASAAIDAWVLLATKLTSSDLAGFVYRAYLHRLATLLRSQSVDVRTSAGEALALLFEAVWQRGKSDDGNESPENSSDDFSSDNDDVGDLSESDDDDDDGNDNGEIVQNSLDDSDLESDEEDVDLEELHDLLSQLATDGTRSRARKERSVQRSVFRSVDVTVRTGESPKITLKIGKERLTFGTWRSVLRLAAMRDVLAQGFYQHVSSNELVCKLLLIPSPKAESLVGQQPHPDSVSVEAKEVSQAKTKMRQQKKKAERSQKHSLRFHHE